MLIQKEPRQICSFWESNSRGSFSCYSKSYGVRCPYENDDEPATVAVMDAYLAENSYENDLSDRRLHHEIYMSDARKTAPEKWKTVIRHPIKKVNRR